MLFYSGLISGTHLKHFLSLSSTKKIPANRELFAECMKSYKDFLKAWPLRSKVPVFVCKALARAPVVLLPLYQST